jgi:hypothetical protein
MTNDRVKVLQAIKDAGVPMLVSMGDADEAVPVANVRQWVETMRELNLNYEYKEYPGVTHGPIMSASMPDIYNSSRTLQGALRNLGAGICRACRRPSRRNENDTRASRNCRCRSCGFDAGLFICWTWPGRASSLSAALIPRTLYIAGMTAVSLCSACAPKR